MISLISFILFLITLWINLMMRNTTAKIHFVSLLNEHTVSKNRRYTSNYGFGA